MVSASNPEVGELVRVYGAYYSATVTSLACLRAVRDLVLIHKTNRRLTLYSHAYTFPHPYTRPYNAQDSPYHS